MYQRASKSGKLLRCLAALPQKRREGWSGGSGRRRMRMMVCRGWRGGGLMMRGKGGESVQRVCVQQ
jgi:hypothetical protein